MAADVGLMWVWWAPRDSFRNHITGGVGIADFNFALFTTGSKRRENRDKKIIKWEIDDVRPLVADFLYRVRSRIGACLIAYIVANKLV